jgi:hypothetical protein
MQRSLIIALLLAALSVGGISLVHGGVDVAKDAVTLDETVLYGDGAAAEGIVVDSGFHCDYHLFWDIRYTVGKVPETHTDFTFSQAERRAYEPHIYYGALFNYDFGGSGKSASGGINPEDESPPIRDVANRTPNGEERTEVIYLKDYYDYYPLQLDFDLPGTGIAANEETLKSFSDYFKIPVDPQAEIEIRVEKNAAGEVSSIGVAPAEGSELSLDSSSAVTNTGCFFTLSCRGSDGALLDTGHIPGGYGIYHLPCPQDAQTDAQDVQLQTVFQVDPQKADNVTLQASADQSELLLVTKENQAYMLTVIDTATVTQLQKIKLLDCPSDESFWKMFIYGDFIVSFAGGRLAVVAETADCTYELRFIADTAKAEESGFAMALDAAMDYDGERLAVASFQRDRVCGFYLAVFDPTGLTYLGRYDNSLDKDLAQSSVPWGKAEEAPLSVSWSE